MGKGKGKATHSPHPPLPRTDSTVIEYELQGRPDYDTGMKHYQAVSRPGIAINASPFKNLQRQGQQMAGIGPSAEYPESADYSRPRVTRGKSAYGRTDDYPTSHDPPAANKRT